MKYLIITDLHGNDPASLIAKEIRQNNIERVVCLGDYDDPSVFRTFRNLPIKKKLVIGNHDYHYVKCYGLTSSTMDDAGRDAFDYFLWWNRKEYAQENKDMLEAINGKKKHIGIKLSEKTSDKKRKLAYVHASLLDLERTNPNVPGNVWFRIFDNPARTIEQFEEMKKMNYWILFRGHDPGYRVFTLGQDKKGKKIEESDVEYRCDELIMLEKDKRHIVSLDAYYYGNYALFDDKSGELTIKNDNSGKKLMGI